MKQESVSYICWNRTRCQGGVYLSKRDMAKPKKKQWTWFNVNQRIWQDGPPPNRKIVSQAFESKSLTEAVEYARQIDLAMGHTITAEWILEALYDQCR